MVELFWIRGINSTVITEQFEYADYFGIILFRNCLMGNREVNPEKFQTVYHR